VQYTGTIKESRVDWLTLTCSDPAKRSAFLEYAANILTKAEQPGAEERPWRWKGYGGVHKGQLTYGRRDDSDIIQLSGAMSHQYGSGLYDLATHCSRIDLAVTVKLGGRVCDSIRNHHFEALDYAKRSRQGLKVDCIISQGEPATLYVGRRQSDLFCRIYNKGLESGEPDYQDCIRYELEVKGAPAERTYTNLGATADRPGWIASAVQQHLTRRAIRPEFGSLDRAVFINALRPVSTDATRLAWLGTHVRPSVEKLLASHKPEELLSVLGFPRSAGEFLRLGRLADQDNHRDPLNEENECD
jgi:hypothetical protein